MNNVDKEMFKKMFPNSNIPNAESEIDTNISQYTANKQYEKMSYDNNMMKSHSSECTLKQPKTAFPECAPVGMAYIPYQMWEAPYDDEIALFRGTIFPSLDKPFIGEEAVNSDRKR